jgi:hypothetical protein
MTSPRRFPPPWQVEQTPRELQALGMRPLSHSLCVCSQLPPHSTAMIGWRELSEGVMEYPVMRLRDYSSHFLPEELDAMTAAYDAAWQHLRTNKPSLTAEQVQVLKRNLAQIILASACNGKRDFMRLKEIALRGLSRRQLHRVGVVVSQLLPSVLLAV